jgi:hypothetical protein
MEEVRNEYVILAENCEGKEHVGDLRVNSKILLKRHEKVWCKLEWFHLA